MGSMRGLTGTTVSKLVAAGLALLVAAVALTGISCLSVTQARCSLSGFLHGRPALDVPYAGTRPAVVDRMLEVTESTRTRIFGAPAVCDGESQVRVYEVRDGALESMGMV